MLRAAEVLSEKHQLAGHCFLVVENVLTDDVGEALLFTGEVQLCLSDLMS